MKIFDVGGLALSLRFTRRFTRSSGLLCAFALFLLSGPGLFAQEEPDGSKLVVGAEAYLGYLAVSPKVDGLRKSVTTADSFDQINRYGASAFITTTPDPLTSFMYWTPGLAISDYSATNKNRILEANAVEANLGLYFNTGNLSEGRVGWYLGVLLHGTFTQLKGAFHYARSSLYTNYIYYDTANIASGATTPFDHIDFLYLSRDKEETLSQEQKDTYLLHKAGVLDRTQYMQLDLLQSARTEDLPGLLLLQAAGVPVESIHKYYSFNNEENRKSALFSGAGVGAEWGYQGDWFFFKHKLIFPYKMTSSKGKLYAESQNFSLGVMYKF